MKSKRFRSFRPSCDMMSSDGMSKCRIGYGLGTVLLFGGAIALYERPVLVLDWKSNLGRVRPWQKVHATARLYNHRITPIKVHGVQAGCSEKGAVTDSIPPFCPYTADIVITAVPGRTGPIQVTAVVDLEIAGKRTPLLLPVTYQAVAE